MLPFLAISATHLSQSPDEMRNKLSPTQDGNFKKKERIANNSFSRGKPTTETFLSLLPVKRPSRKALPSHPQRICSIPCFLPIQQ